MAKKGQAGQGASHAVASSPRAFLFGDSHSYAVQRAAERRAAKRRTTAVSIHRLRKEKVTARGPIVIGDTGFDEFLELIGPLGSDDLVVSMIGGNQHAVFSTIQHPQQFDFLEPEKSRDSLGPEAELIPSKILEGMFDGGIRGKDGKYLKRLRKATSARLIHVLAPPPKRDNDFIREYHETKFAQEGIAALGVSPPELRLKFWRLQSRLLERLCKELEVELMYTPTEALDEDGFLARPYYANDATHANADYGALLLTEIERILTTKASAAA